jgi:hypothetical protein
MAERCTPDHIFESSPRSFGVGSKIGYHHHQRRRSAFQLDASQNGGVSQEGKTKKMAFGLPEGLPRFVPGCLSSPAVIL